MHRLLVVICLALSIGGARVAAEPAPGSVLERVVILQRHGIRAPNLSPAVAAYAVDPWPAWPVAAGELTPHGTAALKTLGAELRRTYAAAGLFAAEGCPAPGVILLHADNATARTRESAAALATGLAPACDLPVQTVVGPAPDPLFVGLDDAVCPFDPVAARAAMLDGIGGDLARPGPGYSAAMAALAAVVSPGGCQAGARCLTAGANTLSIRRGQVRLDGPLADGAALAESLALSYAEALPGAGWGRLDAARLAALTPVHTIFANLLRRPSYVAAHAAAPLARAILAHLQAPAEMGEKLVVFTGHDVNVTNVAALFGVDWTLPGQPDETAPDTAMIFELWRGPDDQPRVSLAVRYQTTEALRTAGASALLPLALPGCDGNGCSLAALTTQIARKLPPDCTK